MSEWVEVGFAWLFFADYEWAPFPLGALVLAGWTLRGWRDRRAERP